MSRADGEFKIAQDPAGLPVPASKASKDVDYTCLECGERAWLHQGEKKAWHYQHGADSTGTCSGESRTHKAACLILLTECNAGRVPQFEPTNRWLPGSECLPWTCSTCRDTAVGRMLLPLEDKFCFPDIQRVSDVGSQGFAFEVFVTHAVDEAKHAAYTGAGILYFEVDGALLVEEGRCRILRHNFRELGLHAHGGLTRTVEPQRKPIPPDKSPRDDPPPLVWQGEDGCPVPSPALVKGGAPVNVEPAITVKRGPPFEVNIVAVRRGEHLPEVCLVGKTKRWVPVVAISERREVLALLRPYLSRLPQ